MNISHSWPKTLWTAILLFATSSPLHAAEQNSPGIRPFDKNPYYWQFKNRPVLLLGGSDEDNLFQLPNLVRQLDRLHTAGGNYVRCTMSSRDEGDLWPFAKVGGRYDLQKWNDAYWKRFETFLKETSGREIIVQIEVWATFDYYRENWRDKNPFNPKNNINYDSKQSGLPTEVNSHPTRTGNPFFRSVPKAKHLPLVLGHQRRFVEKLLEHTLAYDHVLYCMDNETSVTSHWGAYWAAHIREQAKRAGKQVQLTEMWDPWDLSHKMHNATFDHPELYTFVDISQNNHQKGQRHYDNALRQRRRIADHPRPLTNVKIYGADTGRFGKTEDGVQRFWRNIFSGLASARFHRPDSGQGLNDRAVRMIRSAREVTSAIDLFACTPSNKLLGDRQDNEAYCLAETGKQYAVYFPAGGQVTLATKAAKADLTLRWYAIDRSEWHSKQVVSKEGAVVLKTPGKGAWVAVID